MILVTSGAVDPAAHKEDLLHRSLHVDMDLQVMTICVPRYEPGNTCYRNREPARKPERFGLKHVGVDFSAYPDLAPDAYRHYRDIYYTPELGSKLETYISCHPDEVKYSKRFSPSCEHFFVFEPLNALVKVSYRRVYLKDWKKIQAAVSDLLHSFIVGKSS